MTAPCSYAPRAIRDAKSGQKFESRHVLGPNDREVAPIQRRDRMESESLGECHYRGIDCPERKVVISRHQLGDPDPISTLHGLDDEVSGGEVAKKSHFRLPPQPGLD